MKRSDKKKIAKHSPCKCGGNRWKTIDKKNRIFGCRLCGKTRVN